MKSSCSFDESINGLVVSLEIQDSDLDKIGDHYLHGHIIKAAEGGSLLSVKKVILKPPYKAWGRMLVSLLRDVIDLCAKDIEVEIRY